MNLPDKAAFPGLAFPGFLTGSIAGDVKPWPTQNYRIGKIGL